MNTNRRPYERVVVFDIDDTVYLEREYVRSGFAAVGTWVGEHGFGSGFGDACWEAFEAGARAHIFDAVFECRGVPVDPSMIARLVEVYRAHTPEISILPDARQCLMFLASRAVLAAVSDGPLDSQRAKVRSLDLATWLEPIVFTSELGGGRSKPSPHAFEILQTRFGGPSDAYTYVADNPKKDFAGPHMLGWRTVRVRRAGSLHHSLSSGSDVDIEMEDLVKLREALGIAE